MTRVFFILISFLSFHSILGNELDKTIFPKAERINEFTTRIPITFNVYGYETAREIILSGSFNDWSESRYKMKKANGRWTYTVLLSGGKHHFKFIVDKQWIVDPYNSVMEYDGNGNINSVYMVK